MKSIGLTAWRSVFAIAFLLGWLGSPYIGESAARVLEVFFVPNVFIGFVSIGIGMSACIWLPSLAVVLFCILGHRQSNGDRDRPGIGQSSRKVKSKKGARHEG